MREILARERINEVAKLAAFSGESAFGVRDDQVVPDEFDCAIAVGVGVEEEQLSVFLAAFVEIVGVLVLSAGLPQRCFVHRDAKRVQEQFERDIAEIRFVPFVQMRACSGEMIPRAKQRFPVLVG